MFRSDTGKPWPFFLFIETLTVFMQFFSTATLVIHVWYGSEVRLAFIKIFIETKMMESREEKINWV